MQARIGTIEFRRKFRCVVRVRGGGGGGELRRGLFFRLAETGLIPGTKKLTNFDVLDRAR